MLQQESAIALLGGDLVMQDIKACRKQSSLRSRMG